MPNTVGAIAVTGDRENFIQFVAIHDFTYWPSLRLLHDVTAAVSL